LSSIINLLTHYLFTIAAAILAPSSISPATLISILFSLAKLVKSSFPSI